MQGVGDREPEDGTNIQLFRITLLKGTMRKDPHCGQKQSGSGNPSGFPPFKSSQVARHHQLGQPSSISMACTILQLFLCDIRTPHRPELENLVQINLGDIYQVVFPPCFPSVTFVTGFIDEAHFDVMSRFMYSIMASTTAELVAAVAQI